MTYQTVEVQLGAMRPVWLPSAEKPEHLLIVRAAKVSGKPVFQGFAIDWSKLQSLLKDDVADLFPETQFIALPPGEPQRPERAMTARDPPTMRGSGRAARGTYAWSEPVSLQPPATPLLPIPFNRRRMALCGTPD